MARPSDDTTQMPLDMDYGFDRSWTPPAHLPERLEGVIGIDLETRDNGLGAGEGPGWAWEGGGYVVGYGLVADNFRGYLPVRHQGGGNLNIDLVRRWLRSVLAYPLQPKVMANALYDVGWAKRDGVDIHGPIHDVQWAEALLDEHRQSYSLEAISRDRLGVGKDERLLKEVAATYRANPKSDLWKFPAWAVGPYCEQDADLARRLWTIQEALLKEDDLWDIYTLERQLLPLYLDMRWRGVRIDVDRVERLYRENIAQVAQHVEHIRQKTGVRVDIWAAESVAQAFEQQGLSYGLTAKTKKPSITRAMLERTDHWLCKVILKARERDKLAGTFLKGQLLGHLHDGRIHAEFHPLKSDDGGTIGGRGSMSRPNLQFIPTRTPEGKEIRRCFLPEEGETWYCADFSQQEPRLTVHFAALTKRRGKPLPGALEAVQRYRDDPDMSYHQFAAELTGLAYKSAKILNLAIIYGRGVGSVAADLGISIDEAKNLFAQHHREMPFAPALAEIAQKRVEREGCIRTLLGRKCRFPFFEPSDWKEAKGATPLPYDEAVERWGERFIRRAWLHKALNRVIQGSAADQTKKAMLEVYNAGLSHHVLIQVHDELGNSADSPRIANLIAEAMRDAVNLVVPSKVDLTSGENWGDAD